jgi:hypothetical protein
MADYNFTYRLFSVKDIEQWLIHNAKNGLSDKVISRSRALAFIRNPHAQQNDAALVVVYNEQNEAVGYTGAYAEEWSRPIVEGRYFWGSTQWMEPQYRGKGVSGKMMRMIKDAVEDKYVALDSSPASCRLDEKQGSIISYYPRYFFVLNGNDKSFKSKVKNVQSKLSIKKALQGLLDFDYTNRYVSLIDDETYAFIVEHGKKDLFLRKQDYLNWQMRYPFVVPNGGDNKMDADKCEFGECVKRLRTDMVQVFSGGKMCGFYVLRNVDAVCSTWYLYYDEAAREQVFASVAAKVLQLNDVSKFHTFNKDLYDFIKRMGVKSQFSKNNVEQISLTVPSGFEVDASLHIQGGDGDIIC